MLQCNLQDMVFPNSRELAPHIYHLCARFPSRFVVLGPLFLYHCFAMASFQPILGDVPSADGMVDSQMLIAEIDGIALNYLFAEDDYPLEAIKERFIKKYLLLLGLQD